MIHLFIIWLICDIIAAAVRKLSGKKSERNLAGAAALVITAVYLAVGWWFAHHIYITEYELVTDKDVGDGIRVALIADSHLGTTFDGEGFAKQVDRIQALEPDMVIIAGDFVDDDSKKADLDRACEALGGLDTKYGVFFALGNHDYGYYPDNMRDYSADDLNDAMKRNGIHFLTDEIFDADKLCVIGRNDRYNEQRASIDELMQKAGSSRYSIVIDHQPNDYAAEAAAGADLVLSGHTHGGPLIPAGQIGLLIGANDRVYGHERRDSTDFIVTSGIATWAIPFKTGTRSEIVVIDIRNR
jgi:predicted MPP superfamily phosphohydrolase